MTGAVTIPHGHVLFRHQAQALAARQAGARRMIWRWHRQAGKGRGALDLVLAEAVERPGTYAIVSPTHPMSRENFWDARGMDGERYLDAVPPELVVSQNENELALEVRTRDAHKRSRIVFRSAMDADRLRGASLRGVVLDEFATMDGREPLDTIRPSIERSGGFIVISSTPRGVANHFAELWKSVEGDPAWWTRTQTIEDTGLIPRSVVEQELREGQSREWVDQEYYVRFAVGLIGAYYADVLTQAEQEGRITDLAHRPLLKVWTAWDIGISDLTVVLYLQPLRDPGGPIHVLRADAFEGAALPEIIAGMQRHGYVFGRHLVPHDAGHREKGTGQTYVDVGRGLGVKLEVTPRLDLLEGISAVRALFSRLVFDRRGCQKLLEALGSYTKVWDPKGKVYRQSPAHTWSSHYADAMRTFATAYRDRDLWDIRPKVFHARMAGSAMPRRSGSAWGGRPW
jgi:phage terminase large subunit